MKVLIIVALFAFVAVKLSQAAPVPDDDKKVEVPTSSVAVPDVTSPAAAPVEVKSVQSSSSVGPALAMTETPVPAV